VRVTTTSVHHILTGIALVCTLLSSEGCAASDTNSAPLAVVTAPPKKVLTMPTVSIPTEGTLGAEQWQITTDGTWAHWHSVGHAPIDIYRHNGRTYELQTVQLDYVKGVKAPYLVQVTAPTDAPFLGKPHESPRGSSADPPVGALIITPGHDDRFDLTFRTKRGVKTLADFNGPRIVDFFEDDCIGCTGEKAELGDLFRALQKHSGILVVVTSQRFSRVQNQIRSIDPAVPVTLDNHYSVYSAFDIRHLPLALVQSSSGQFVDAYVGMLQESDASDLLREVGINVATGKKT